MEHDPFTLWRTAGSAARFADPAAIARRATAFERTIRRRNLIETLAGALVIAIFAPLAAGALWVGEVPFALACLMLAAAAAYVIAVIRRDGATQARAPEQPCRDHLRCELERQRDLLRRVPRWYLAPFLPGMALLYGVVGWQSGDFGGIALPAGATVVFFVFVAWLNAFAARQLDGEIRLLDEAA